MEKTEGRFQPEFPQNLLFFLVLLVFLGCPAQELFFVIFASFLLVPFQINVKDVGGVLVVESIVL